MIYMDGKVIDAITGMASNSSIEAAIEKALAGKSTPAPFIVN
jgi:hypothetical protein